MSYDPSVPAHGRGQDLRGSGKWACCLGSHADVWAAGSGRYDADSAPGAAPAPCPCAGMSLVGQAGHVVCVSVEAEM